MDLPATECGEKGKNSNLSSICLSENEVSALDESFLSICKARLTAAVFQTSRVSADERIRFSRAGQTGW